jgi:hypothetical protein
MELMHEERGGEGDDLDDDLDEEIGMVNARSSGVRNGASTRRQNQEDEDSDFDM